jgi:hypothetical protein
MLFPEEHSQHLKKWIVKRLENTFVFLKSILSLRLGTCLTDTMGPVATDPMPTLTCSPTMSWPSCATMATSTMFASSVRRKSQTS